MIYNPSIVTQKRMGSLSVIISRFLPYVVSGTFPLATVPSGVQIYKQISVKLCLGLLLKAQFK